MIQLSKNIYKDLIIQDYKDEFDLIEAFIREASNLKDSKEYDNVSIYGKKDFIYDIFKLLITDYDFEIGSIDFSREYFDKEYGCEYCLRVFDTLLLVVEKAYNDEFKPYNIDGIIFMYQEDCSQGLIDNALNNDAKVILFGIGDSDDVCVGNHICEKSEDNTDISRDNAVYKVNGKPVSKKEYEDKMAEFDKVYRRHLLDICEMMDEMNEWRKLFRW